MHTKILSFAFGAVVMAGLGFGAYSLAATAGEIFVCVTKTGAVKVIGESFKRSDCKANETLLSWNIMGPQGEKGDKGDSAQHGAGNIAFWSTTNRSLILKTDGTVWDLNSQSVWVLRPGAPNYLPVAISEIIQWDVFALLDNSGNLWKWSNNSWVNHGHP